MTLQFEYLAELLRKNDAKRAFTTGPEAQLLDHERAALLKQISELEPQIERLEHLQYSTLRDHARKIDETRPRSAPNQRAAGVSSPTRRGESKNNRNSSYAAMTESQRRRDRRHGSVGRSPKRRVMSTSSAVVAE